MEKHMAVIRNRHSAFYMLVAERFGAENADALFAQFVDASVQMSPDGRFHTSYGYIAMRRYERGLARSQSSVETR